MSATDFNPEVVPSDDRVMAARKIASLEARVDKLERSNPTIQLVAGTPTTDPRDGTPALDTSNPRLWLRRNGNWQYANLN